MENPGFLSEMIAAIARELKGVPFRGLLGALQPAAATAAEPSAGHQRSGETGAHMIRPTTRGKVASDLHRQEWP
jgi:hypothetical protein